MARDMLPPGDPCGLDIDEAARRLIDQLAALAKAIEEAPVLPAEAATVEK
jgi:hypothetical protein